MAQLVKQYINVPIIVGGLHPTILPDFVIKNPNIDMICIGEGEQALLELIESMQIGKVDYSIRNIWFRRDGEIIRNPLRSLIQDLNSLPFPNKEIFRKYGCFSNRLYVMTGRGCPYQCTYCFNMYYRKLLCAPGFSYVRRRSVENVIDELKVFKSKYNIKEVYFYDDIFTINDAWIGKFCKSYRQEICLPFKILVHPQTIKEETMRLLADAGCIYVDIGIESGSEQLRYKLLKRNMTNQDLINAAKILKKVGIRFCVLNMVGLPTETREQMWETYELNEKMKSDGAIVSFFYPFPKTELTDYCLENGFLEQEDYVKVCNGEGRYKDGSILEGSILKNIEVEEAKRLQVLIPILLKMPRFLRPLIKKIPINSLTRIISIFFISIPRNAYTRFKELIVMFVKTHYLYLFKG